MITAIIIIAVAAVAYFIFKGKNNKGGNKPNGGGSSYGGGSYVGPDLGTSGYGSDTGR
jgi:hypothetical protein